MALAKSDPTRAEELATEALRLAPGCRIAPLALAIGEERQGRPREAVAHLRRAAGIQPESALVLVPLLRLTEKGNLATRVDRAAWRKALAAARPDEELSGQLAREDASR